MGNGFSFDANAIGTPTPTATKRIPAKKGEQDSSLESSYSTTDTFVPVSTADKTKPVPKDNSKLIKNIEIIISGEETAIRAPQGALDNPQFIIQHCKNITPIVEQFAEECRNDTSVRAKSDQFASSIINTFSVARSFLQSKLDVIEKEPSTEENKHKIWDLKEDIRSMDKVLEKFLSNREVMGLSSDIVAKLMSAKEQNGEILERIIVIAEAKGYELPDANDMLKELEEDHGIMFTINDDKEATLLNKIKKELNELVQKVISDIRQKNNDQQSLDDAAFKKVLSERKRELNRIEKDLIQKLTNERLKNKLKAIVIHLGFLLKHSEALTVQMAESYRDDVTRIKWQTMPTQKTPQ